MTVIIAREAEDDLEQIADQALRDYPQRYAAVAEYGPQLRRFPYRGYSIYYQVLDGDAVVIIHILNDALEHERILKS